MLRQEVPELLCLFTAPTGKKKPTTLTAVSSSAAFISLKHLEAMLRCAGYKNYPTSSSQTLILFNKGYRLKHTLNLTSEDHSSFMERSF